MKKNILFLFVCCVTLLHNTQAQSLVWVKALQPTPSSSNPPIIPSTTIPRSVVDGLGNMYTVTSFGGTIDADSGSGVSNFVSAGNLDILISKFDTQGNFLWAKRIGGLFEELWRDIAIDATGNVFVIGSFKGTLDFDPSAAVSNLTAIGTFGQGDGFSCKLDTNGNFVCVTQFSNPRYNLPYSIVTDLAGNSYVAGFGVNIDPVTSSSVNAAYVYKIGVAGNLIWRKEIFVLGNGITVDSQGNILVACSNSILKLSANNGDLIWRKDIGARCVNIVADTQNDYYITLSGGNMVDLDPSYVGYYIPRGSLLKLDTNGNFVWAIGLGGDESDGTGGVRDIALDAQNNIYLTGYFQRSQDFDPGVGVYNLPFSMGADIFMAKLDSFGNLIWAKSMIGAGNEYTGSIGLDNANNIYISGGFNRTVDFDPSPAFFNVPALSGSSDLFMAKYAQCDISINTNTLATGIIGTPYNQTITQTGLTGTPSWSVSAGILPAGLSINASSGIITGTATTTGIFNIAIQVTNGNCRQFRNYTLIINCPVISFSNITANNATVGTNYLLNASVIGNTNSVIYSVIPNLPSGLQLNPTSGIIAGTPTANAVLATYTVTALQSGTNCSQTQDYTFSVSTTPTNTNNCQISILPLVNTLPTGFAGVPYSTQIVAFGEIGATFTFTTTFNPLPNGLTLTPAGLLSGTPTATGTATVVFVATSNAGCVSAPTSFMLVISTDPATSIDNTLSNQIKVSPNPSKADFNVDFGTLNLGKSALRVYDMQGKTVFSSEIEINNNTMKISLENMASGIYLLEINSTKWRILKRLIKNN